MIDDNGPGRQLPSLTSFRWIAASLVFLCHVQGVLVRHDGWFQRVSEQGVVGVSFFFVLSGFVLAWTCRSDDTFGAFVQRRIARIYPAYAVVAVAALPVIWAIGEIRRPRHVLQALLPLTLLQSWIPHQAIAFSGNRVSWSLSCEAFFYAMFPLLIRRVRPMAVTRLWLLLGASMGSMLVIALALHPTDGSTTWNLLYANPLLRFPEFVTGVALAALLRSGVRIPWLRFWPAVALAIASYAVAGWVPLYLRPYVVTLVPIVALLAASAQADLEGTTPRVLRSQTMLRLGQWSFSFYLVHELILRGFAHAVPSWPVVWSAVVAYLGSTVVAALVFHFVEQPLERRLRRLPISTMWRGGAVKEQPA